MEDVVKNHFNFFFWPVMKNVGKHIQISLWYCFRLEEISYHERDVGLIGTILY